SFLIFNLSFVILSRPVLAEEKVDVLTKQEAVRLLSATDFVKNKIGQLLSWTIGYDLSKINRVRLTPTIKYIQAVPRRIPPDGRTVLEIYASVDDPKGLSNISGVRADLSAIGRLANTMLVDNGLYGDAHASDGIYTLQASVSSKIEIGKKEIPIAAANKNGWLAIAKTTLNVSRDPVISDFQFSPAEAISDGQTLLTLQVKIDNPGRLEDIRQVSLDLSALGYSELLVLRNDGRGGDSIAGDDIYTVQFTVPAAAKNRDYQFEISAVNLVGGTTVVKDKLRVSR
ncbi:MAG: hypothetical protein KJ811_00220, partial [Candidatus Margulisbacteria bacterium]|nr:hypothetical protein [Candidatus Margulisiibacteriota bacterium]